MSALIAYISETRTVPKNCLHLTTVCVFIEPETLGHQTVTHQAPLYHPLFNKKKLPLTLCNTQNKCVHIYSISVT